MKKLIHIAICLLFSSCFSKYKYWDIDKFRMDPKALHEQEPIKLLYASRGPDFNKDMEYYIHLVAVSLETGDTVNILTTALNDLKQEDGDKEYAFFCLDSMTGKNMLAMELGKDISHIDQLKDVNPPKIDKVARDPEFDDIAMNTFPTVIGYIGTVTPAEKK